MSELEKAWTELQSLRFPHDSADAELGRIHADLALYDTRVAGVAATVITGGRPEMHLLEADEIIQRKLESIVALRDHRAGEAAEYLDYVNRLGEVLRLARMRR